MAFKPVCVFKTYIYIKLIWITFEIIAPSELIVLHTIKKDYNLKTKYIISFLCQPSKQKKLIEERVGGFKI